MRKICAALAATAVASGMLTTLPVTATAATCEDPTHPIAADQSLSADITVGIKKTKTMPLDLYTYDGCDVDGATATVKAPRSTKTVKLRKAGVANGYVHWVGELEVKPSSLRNSDAGVWPVILKVTGEHSESITREASVRRASRLSFNAGPEPVRNDKLTFAGTLERASWNSDRYVAWRDQEIDVSAWIDGGDPHDPDYVGAVTTNDDGRYRKTWVFHGPGEYFADADTTRTTSGVRSAADEVG